MTIRKCRHCNQVIPKERQLNAVYCSDSCKARYHEKKQASAPPIISALVKTDTVSQSYSPKKENLAQALTTKSHLSELRGIVNDEQTTTSKIEMPTIHQETKPSFTTIQVESKAYQTAKAHLQKLKQEKNDTLANLTKINQRIKEVKAQKGYGWQAGGALTGLLLLNNSKNDKKTDPWKLLLGAGVGLLAGTVARDVTNDHREVQKNTEIAQLNSWLKEWNEHLKNVNVHIYIAENTLAKTNQFETKIIEHKPLMPFKALPSNTTNHLPALMSF